MTSGIPYDIAVERGICGAQRKNEDAPCEGPRDEKGRSICGRHCGAKNRRGYPCSQHGRTNGRCNRHGAESLAGPESPRWVDGGTSKYGAIFSGDALEHYKVAREDDRYLELRENLAVLDTLFVEELKAAKVGGGGALWEELGTAWERFAEADPTRDATTAGRALRMMGELIKEGVGRHAAQNHALEIQEKFRRTTETERKRIVDQERTITQVQAMSFAAANRALIYEAVSVVDEAIREEILARYHAGLTRLIREYVGGDVGIHPAGIDR